MPEKIVLASNNLGKVKEFQTLLKHADIELRPQADFNISEADETGLSFVENAIIKARHASEQAQLPAIADDSGLEVDFLKGAPGIYSSRFAGEHASDADNNAKLLELLAELPPAQRSARFQCLLVYLRHPQDPTPTICQGTWEGHILTSAQGDNGFGYDPLFFVPERQCSSAQLSAEDKNQLSHRGKAMKLLLKHLVAQA
ncbi:MAG: RdgB/HAM1 family non-canonical purine NTP pyrophosphatase [Porticoccaceae bacterium]|nr:RdgB/HAM1 family non-canonical purine NTP pyrophosphatase [Porticoccaceae bacterium]